MSRAGGGDQAVGRQRWEDDDGGGGDDDDLFEAASSVSGGESDDEGGRFSDGGAEEGGDGQGLRWFPPQPLRRLNSDSLHDMSGVMAQLPVKKGLSRYYEGKSQSFACMSEVRSLEDLRKKESPYKQRMKPCKSQAALGGMAKKASSSSCANLSLMAATNGFRAPPIPMNKNYHHQ